MQRFFLAVLMLLLSPTILASDSNTIRVVTTIAPIQSLVSAIMQNVATPVSLVPAGTSEHTYSLKPSEAMAIAQADVIFWVNEDIENFFPRIIPTLNAKQRVIKLINTPGLTLLTKRTGTNWAEHHDHHEAEHSALDGHIWLDPRNAILMTVYISEQLATIDSKHAAQYRNNATALQQRLQDLDHKLQQQLNPIKDNPYWVFHDAYQYFENRYQLNAQGAIAIHPEQPLSAKQVQFLQQKILSTKAQCVFAEPQFLPAIVQRITEKTGAKSGILDPIGMDKTIDATSYFTLTHNLAHALTTCLQH